MDGTTLAAKELCPESIYLGGCKPLVRNLVHCQAVGHILHILSILFVKYQSTGLPNVEIKVTLQQ